MSTAVNGCFYCGKEQREHAQEWHALVGYHVWVEPTDMERKNRLQNKESE